MVDFCVQRKGSTLLPISESDQVELFRLPERRVFSIEAHPRAPLKLQRWYRAALQILVEATGRWPSADVANREITIEAGYLESFVISPATGEYRITAESKSGWDLIQWSEFLMRAMPIMLKFADETPAKFRHRVDKFFGISLQEAMKG